MKKIIYLGMQNKPFEIFETVSMKKFRVVYQYRNSDGKKVMLKAIEDNFAHYPMHNYVSYLNNNMPICEQGKLYSVDILNQGYSGHYFELVEVE